MAEGWAWPNGAAKNHYIVEGRALCGKWMTFATPEAKEFYAYVDCAVCEKRRARRAKQMNDQHPKEPSR